MFGNKIPISLKAGDEEEEVTFSLTEGGGELVFEAHRLLYHSAGEEGEEMTKEGGGEGVLGREVWLNPKP